LNFPHVGQAFVVERHVTKKKTGESTLDIAYGITSRTPQQAGARIRFSKSTAVTGRLRTVVTTSSTGTMMKTAVASAPVTARKTSRGFAVSPSACSNPKAAGAWRRKCDD